VKLDPLIRCFVCSRPKIIIHEEFAREVSKYGRVSEFERLQILQDCRRVVMCETSVEAEKPSTEENSEGS
jgi:hypothetical protein